MSGRKAEDRRDAGSGYVHAHDNLLGAGIWRSAGGQRRTGATRSARPYLRGSCGIAFLLEEPEKLSNEAIKQCHPIDSEMSIPSCRGRANPEVLAA